MSGSTGASKSPAIVIAARMEVRLTRVATGPLAICPMASTCPDMEMTVARVSKKMTVFG